MRFTRIPGWLLLTIGLIIGVEFLLRLPAVQRMLPDPRPTLWHAQLIQHKIDYLTTYAASHTVNVLFIGNSTMQAGVNPTVFDTVRKKAAGAGSFNASIEGLPPKGMLLFLKIYLRQLQPDVIVYGLSPQDLNANSPWAKDVTDRVFSSPLALAAAKEGWQGQLLALLYDHSMLFRYRFVLLKMIMQGGNYPPLPEVYFDRRGYHPIERVLADTPEAQRRSYYNRAGVMNYAVEGEQMTAFDELIEYVRARGIQLILVNMPIADEYYENFDSPDDYDLYMAALQASSRRYQLPLWDLEGDALHTFGPREFADFNHLNIRGAQRLSDELAERFNRLRASEAVVGHRP